MNRLIQPEITLPNKIDFSKPEKTSLDNGIKVYKLNGGEQEICRIELVFDAGKKHQSKPLIGALTNEMLLEGSDGISGKEISNQIDFYGAFIQTECHQDHAAVIVYTLNKYLENVLPLLSKVAFKPDFNQSEFEILRKNLKQSFLVNSDKVGTLARRRFTTELFKDHAYGKIASLNDFDNINTSELKEFYTSNYNGKSFEIFITGNLNRNIDNLLNKHFGQQEFVNNVVKEDSIVSTNIPGFHLQEKADAIQSGIRVGRTMFNRLDSDFFGMQVLNYTLGGYFGSRLMSNIREDKGYTYGIGSALVSLKQGGYFFITTEVGEQHTENTLKEITFEIDRLKQDLLGEEELTTVKNSIVGNFLKSTDGVFAMMDSYKELHAYDLDYDYYTNYLETVRSITASDIRNLAENYLNESLFTKVIAGKKF